MDIIDRSRSILLGVHDGCYYAAKTCAGDSAENLAIVRRIGYNVVKQDPKKRSIRGKRLDAGWDNAYLMTLLSKVFEF